MSVEAAEPLGVPVFPGLPYGMTAYFMAYPGTISLTPDTYERLLCDVLDSLARIAGVEYPARQKPMVDTSRLRSMEPAQLRECLGDGNFGGRYQRSDEEMLAIWRVAVHETRALIDAGW